MFISRVYGWLTRAPAGGAGPARGGPRRCLDWRAS